MQDLLPNYSAAARKDILSALFAKSPTAEIVAMVLQEHGEQITTETIDRARLLARAAIDRHYADRHEIIFADALDSEAINQAPIKAALDQQAVMAWDIGKDLHNEMLDLQTEPNDTKRSLKRQSMIAQLKDLSAAAGNITKAQIMVAEAKMRIPHLDRQLNGKKEAPKTEITVELVTELERVLGVLPYDEEQPPETLIDASTEV